ncbi:MAG: ATP-binding cassette domain-containing protein, partial [Lachnospiraceae bacterium]|nr:ATP-binding cassette domain-containing protein [Lachnospiraceae bacterium]
YDLYDKRNTYINKLSFGMQRKLSIVMSLIGNNRLIVLDEPTNGVDTAGILQLKHDLKRYVEKGSIVLITSHVLDWIEKICTRCIFLKSGEIVQDVQVGTVILEDEYEKIYVNNVYR